MYGCVRMDRQCHTFVSQLNCVDECKKIILMFLYRLPAESKVISAYEKF
jgi:hypothetical protein